MSATRLIGVVGVTFVAAYPNNLHMLRKIHEDAVTDLHGEQLAVVLVRNPANRFDKNAIEVHVPALGTDMAMIGHVPRDIAARLAPLLDQGVRFHTHISDVRINPAHMDRPGIDIAVQRVEVAA
jgi:hypothetical protein